MDEVVLKIDGVAHWLWRAGYQAKMVVDVLVQSRQDTQADKPFLGKLLKRQMRSLRVMITDKLANCGSAKKDMMPSVKRRQHKGLDNRVKNSDQPRG